MRIVPSQFPLAATHAVLDRPIVPPFPDDSRYVLFGLGCFWGAEKRFWQQPALYTTAVGYAGGSTTHPSYRDVCAGNTGHAEVVLVVFQGTDEVLDRLLDVFWESHNPTQGMRQGNDIGTQYRSAIFTSNAADLSRAEDSRNRYQQALKRAGHDDITTEIATGHDFYYAEDYHQQYLAKNPAGYCGLGGTGVSAR
jgi:peptide-methionine (S)-S-oxide reductase